MTKKILLAAAALLASVNPFLPSVGASSNGWAPAVASAAWTYPGYTVQRLALDVRAVGPIALGSAVLVAEPPTACLGSACDAMTVSLFKNGVRTSALDVPLSALDADRFAKNGNRLIYAKPTSEGMFAVYGLNLDTGAETTLLSNVSIPGGSNVDVMEDNAGTYFLTADVRFSNANTAFTQRALFVWDAQRQAVRPVVGAANQTDRRIDMLDVRDGVVFAKMGFADGSSQLWLFDSKNVDFNGGKMTEIPQTWTDATGSTQYGRFLPDGGVEFFEHFTRFTWHPGDVALSRGGELLSWYRPISAAIKTDGTYLAWLDANDQLSVSDGAHVRLVGSAPGGTFALSNGTLFYDGKALNLATNGLTNAPFRVADAQNISLAGVDAGSNVYVGSGSTALRVGFGTSPVVSDPQHVYWRGADGIYVASLSVRPSAVPTSALRTADDATVYLVTADGVRHAIPNPQVYLSWFPSWSSVQVVSAQELSSHVLGSPAAFPVGALLKLNGDFRVYALGKDGFLHHVANAATGYGLFGETWYGRIVTVSEMNLTAYPFGAPLASVADGANLF